MLVDEPVGAHAVRPLDRVVVGEEQARLAGALREVLVAEVQRGEVVLTEEERVAAAVGLRSQGVHDQKVALLEKVVNNKQFWLQLTVKLYLVTWSLRV